MVASPREPGGTKGALWESDGNGLVYRTTEESAGMCESRRAWPFTSLISSGSFILQRTPSVAHKGASSLCLLLSSLPWLDSFLCLCLNTHKRHPAMYQPLVMNELDIHITSLNTFNNKNSSENIMAACQGLLMEASAHLRAAHVGRSPFLIWGDHGAISQGTQHWNFQSKVAEQMWLSPPWSCPVAEVSLHRVVRHEDGPWESSLEGEGHSHLSQRTCLHAEQTTSNRR